jgi:hypothetical protein
LSNSSIQSNGYSAWPSAPCLAWVNILQPPVISSVRYLASDRPPATAAAVLKSSSPGSSSSALAHADTRAANPKQAPEIRVRISRGGGVTRIPGGIVPGESRNRVPPGSEEDNQGSPRSRRAIEPDFGFHRGRATFAKNVSVAVIVGATIHLQKNEMWKMSKVTDVKRP